MNKAKPLSPKMAAALKLVRRGHTAYEAAKLAGITSGTIYKNATYRAILAERASKEAK